VKILWNLFNDFDDFNGYAAKDTTDRAVYDVSIEVVYVEDLKPKIVAGGPQWNKRMTVTVSSEYMSSPVVSQYIFSYF
jgi:Zn-dependent M28 family amino/carboxypeptidase